MFFLYFLDLNQVLILKILVIAIYYNFIIKFHYKTRIFKWTCFLLIFSQTKILKDEKKVLLEKCESMEDRLDILKETNENLKHLKEEYEGQLKTQAESIEEINALRYKDKEDFEKKYTELEDIDSARQESIYNLQMVNKKNRKEMLELKKKIDELGMSKVTCQLLAQSKEKDNEEYEKMKEKYLELQKIREKEIIEFENTKELIRELQRKDVSAVIFFSCASAIIKEKKNRPRNWFL